jgi:hypothetical protein
MFVEAHGVGMGESRPRKKSWQTRRSARSDSQNDATWSPNGGARPTARIGPLQQGQCGGGDVFYLDIFSLFGLTCGAHVYSADARLFCHLSAGRWALLTCD